MSLWFANACVRLCATRACLLHAWHGDVPIIARWEWVVFAVKSLYLPQGSRR